MPDRQADPALLAAIRIRYQPIIRLTDARLSHAEVLARAANADGTMRGAAPIVEGMTGSGAALSLTTAIIRRSLDEYFAHGFAGTTLAFNLSLDAMLHPELPAQIAALRHATGIAAANISFELTETSPVRDFAAAAASIRALHAAGHGIALDDISPDMPFLAALLDLPLHAIKFGQELVTAPGTLAFIHAMAAKAARRGLISIAEGIETETQLHAMREAGITHGQGYLFAHPLTAEEMSVFLKERR